MLGLHDRVHAFVVFQRFRNLCRSKVTDGVAVETARIAMNTHKKKGSRDSVRPEERMCAHRREGKGRKRIVVLEGREERDDLNAWLTRSFPRFCCASALPPALSLQGHRCC